MLLFIMGIVFLLWLWAYVTKLKYKMQEKAEKLKYERRIKQDSIKIIVPFDDCIVREKKSYATKPATNDYRVQGLNSILDSRKTEVTIQNISSIIKVKAKINGTTKTFTSDSLSMDRENLLIKLYMQKELVIYYNKYTRKYFFNLSFLY